MQNYNLRLSDKEYKEGILKKISSEAQRSINDLIREAVRDFIKKQDKSCS